MKKTVAQWDGDWLDIFWYGATEPDRAGEWDQRDGFGILRFEGSGPLFHARNRPSSGNGIGSAISRIIYRR